MMKARDEKKNGTSNSDGGVIILGLHMLMLMLVIGVRKQGVLKCVAEQAGHVHRLHSNLQFFGVVSGIHGIKLEGMSVMLSSGRRDCLVTIGGRRLVIR